MEFIDEEPGTIMNGVRTRGYGLVVEGQGVPATSGAAMGQLVDHNFALYFFNPLFSTPSTVLYVILLIFVLIVRVVIFG